MVWSFCHPVALLNLGHNWLNTAFWGWLVSGCYPALESGTQGFTRATVGYWGGEAGVTSEPHTAVLIYTFPLSLRKLPFAAVQQVVAVAGLAVVSVPQHLHIALDVDESFSLQLMKCSPCRGF